MKNEALNLLGNENGKNRQFVMDKVLHPVIFRSELHECQKTTSQKHLLWTNFIKRFKAQPNVLVELEIVTKLVRLEL